MDAEPDDDATGTPRGARLWIAGARVRTLPAAVVPVVVGTAAASLDDGEVIAWRAIAALVVSVAIQVATNFANDYSDGVRGTDDDGSRIGPMRLVGSGLASPSAVKRAALLSFAVAAAAGLALVAAVGPELLIVGAASILAGWFYTGGPRPYGYAGLGEVFVFVFFGVVATAGADYVQTEALSGAALLAAVPVGLLATALLVVNNLRDIPGDTSVGKHTLAVRIGAPRTRALYVALLVGAVLVVPLLAWTLQSPGPALALVAVPLANRPVTAVLERAEGAALIAVLAATGLVQLVFGIGLAIGLAVS